jgi:hypothetical protein
MDEITYGGLNRSATSNGELVSANVVVVVDVHNRRFLRFRYGRECEDRGATSRA